MATLQWEFDPQEIDAIHRQIDASRDSAFVDARIDKNVEGDPPAVSKRDFWDAHLIAQLTSQQRSGPESPVSVFIQDELEAISLDACRDVADLHQHVTTTLREHGGIRFYDKIGRACDVNYQRLFEEDGWDDIAERLETLREFRCTDPRPAHAETEREVCKLVSDEIDGEGLHRIGPKQSRNLLQVLGFTRYETPLDSRISRWCNDHLDLPYRVTGDGLSDPEFYDFHMDLVQAVCNEADVLPCVFDAAVFSSYDDGGWSEEQAAGTF